MRHFISRRGNLKGPNFKRENSPDYIIEAINRGFDCQIDLQILEEVIYLGMNPRYIIDVDFLLINAEKLWIHCLNINSIDYLLQFPELNVYLHENDSCVLTSKKNVWDCKHNELSLKNTINAMPEWNGWKTNAKSLGVCSDYIMYVRDVHCGKYDFEKRIRNKCVKEHSKYFE